MRKAPQPLKRLPVPLPVDLTADSVKLAIAALQSEPHDGWAYLVVHPAQVVRAQRILRDLNGKPFDLRVQLEERHGMLSWFVRTSTAEVAVL